MRTIIIGDIHGCFKELVLLLEKVQFDQRRDLLIILGDMIDRGPRSFQVFEYLRSLKSHMGEACVLIRGNHEQMMIDYGAGCDCALEMWEADGGSDTRKDFLAHHASIEEAARWLKENTILYYRTPWFQCVHAGVLKEHPCRNSEECLLWDRSALFLNQYCGRLTIVGHTPLLTVTHFTGKRGISHPLRYGDVQFLPETGIICIDTGCVGGGRLTAVVIEGERFYLA